MLPRYRELVCADRRFLVPVIGSLGDFPLSEAQKRQVFEMTVEALAVVDETDLPAIVRTLLASLTKGTASLPPSVYSYLPAASSPIFVDTAKTTMSAIRMAAAESNVLAHTPILLELILNALRLHPYAGMAQSSLS